MADTILILGNGFDLAMGRKTSYSDFIEFANNLFLEKEDDLQSFLNSNNIDIEKYKDNYYLRFINENRSTLGENWCNLEIMISQLAEAIDYFKLNAEQTGIWTALSIHDTSSVVSAAAFHSTEALRIATIMKLTRTLWIIPIVIILSILNKSENKKIKFPIFILFFILASIVATIINLPAIYSLLTQIGKMLLSLALYMIGTSLNVQTIKKMMGKNLLFGIMLWIFSIISGYMIMIFL